MIKRMRIWITMICLLAVTNAANAGVTMPESFDMTDAYTLAGVILGALGAIFVVKKIMALMKGA